MHGCFGVCVVVRVPVKKRVKEAESLCSQLSLSFHAPLPSLVTPAALHLVKRHRAGGGGGVLASFHWYRFGTIPADGPYFFLYLFINPQHFPSFICWLSLQTQLCTWGACGEPIRQAEPGAEAQTEREKKEERGGNPGPNMLLHYGNTIRADQFLSSGLLQHQRSGQLAEWESRAEGDF